jgi:hypothetical protein
MTARTALVLLVVTLPVLVIAMVLLSRALTRGARVLAWSRRIDRLWLFAAGR